MAQTDEVIACLKQHPEVVRELSELLESVKTR